MPALALAVAAHGLLLIALAWGVAWQHYPVELGSQVELWAQLPMGAAPRAADPEFVAPQVNPPGEQALATGADIVTEHEKKALQEAGKNKQMQEERLAPKRLQPEQAIKKGASKRQTAKEYALTPQDEQQRQESIKRLAKLAGVSGPAGGTGTAAQSSGPSPSYAGRIAARIKSNIVFTDVVAGNPRAEVQIRLAPDGTILAKKLITSSGVKAWDEAVLRAIDKTEILPKDIDGKVVPEFLTGFRPND